MMFPEFDDNFEELIRLPFDELTQTDWEVACFGEVNNEEVIEFLLDLPFDEIPIVYWELLR